ncbi:MAG: helix-turn-helix domain-containing protein [Halocynthiibacter sp.]
MANKKYVVELTIDQRAHLSGLIKKGKSSAQANLKARILLKADQGKAGEHWLDKTICAAMNTNMSMVGRVRETCVNEGFEAVFVRKKRKTPPITPIFDGEAEARLIALACSEPPQGQARWTLRLLADKVVELEIVDKAHFNTVGRVLKKTNSNPTAVNIG